MAMATCSVPSLATFLCNSKKPTSSMAVVEIKRGTGTLRLQSEFLNLGLASPQFFSGGQGLWNSSYGCYNNNRKRRAQRTICMAADFYSTLGVPRSANSKEIKSAYRRLARQYHPDVNKEPGAEQKFKEISAAYEVLSDDEKRSLYDQYGEAGVKGAAGGGAAYTTNPYDLFETFFGASMGGFSGMDTGFGTRRRETVIQGDDIRFDMTLEFSEAIFGAEKELEVSHLETCETCNGTGAKIGSRPKKCKTCGGRGQVMRTQQTPFGLFSQVSVCPSCGGQGQVISDYCRKCAGEGRLRVKKDLKVKIPPGVNNGSTLRVRGEGDAGPRGGPAGDLYVYLNVKEIPGIQRDGINLSSIISVSYVDAILGTVVKVKTVEGTQELKIPPGTQPGDVLVLSKLGVPKLSKPSFRGDHMFTVKVTIPTRISEKERALIEELSSLRNPKDNRGSVRSASWPQRKKNEQKRRKNTSRDFAGRSNG
uniref:TSA: Wollemia nobilis Ref_Wollemi_Transcript_12006_1562 transcribed RNA sequence n=1 Tax=Wollemia nobilis TaxID=56998 RepID=A0A0C9S636_9CONI